MSILEGLEADVLSRLSDWSFKDTKVVVVGYEAKLYETVLGDAASLATTLSQLEALHTTGNSVVELTDWQWSDESLQVLIASLPALQHLQLSVEVTLDQPLTDELLGVVLQLGTRVRKLAVPSLALQSNQHSSAVWPWQQLTVGTAGFSDHVGTVEVSQLMKLPCPRAHAGAAIQCYRIEIDSCTAEVAGYRLIERLQRLSFEAYKLQKVKTYRKDVLSRTGLSVTCASVRWITIALHAPPHTTTTTRQDGGTSIPQASTTLAPQSDALRTQLSVLRAVHPYVKTQEEEKQSEEDVSWPEKLREKKGARVELVGWQMTHDTIEALRGLPELQGHVDFTQCTSWPLEPAQYTHLAQCVPTSYEAWLFDMCPCSPVFKSICGGVKVRREGLGLPALLCMVPSQEVESEHVKVTSMP